MPTRSYPRQASIFILPVKVLKNVRRKCIIKIVSAKCSPVFNICYWKIIIFWLRKLKVFPGFYFICQQGHQQDSVSYHPSHARASWHSLTSRMLAQYHAPHPGPYASFPSVCSSMSGVTLLSPEVFLKPQPSYLWFLCVLHYFMSDFKSLIWLALECGVLISPDVQPPFLYSGELSLKLSANKIWKC